MTNMMLPRPKKQKSEHEHEEPTLTHDLAASRLVKSYHGKQNRGNHVV